MNLSTIFDMNERVGIIELDNHPATIVEIKLDGKNLYYRVEYWWNGKPENIYQFEWELSKLKARNEQDKTGLKV
jgi:hypothetical protein